MALDICGEKCQAETVEKALKSLSESQQHTVDVKSFNMYAFSLKMHSSDISDSEKEMKEELVNINTAHQQSNKIVS